MLKLLLPAMALVAAPLVAAKPFVDLDSHRELAAGATVYQSASVSSLSSITQRDSVAVVVSVEGRWARVSLDGKRGGWVDLEQLGRSIPMFDDSSLRSVTRSTFGLPFLSAEAGLVASGSDFDRYFVGDGTVETVTGYFHPSGALAKAVVELERWMSITDAQQWLADAYGEQQGDTWTTKSATVHLAQEADSIAVTYLIR